MPADRRFQICPKLSDFVRFRSLLQGAASPLVIVRTKSDFADGGPGTCSALGPTQRPDMPAIAGVLASPSPRSSPAYNASKSKFRNLSKQIPAGASLAFGEPSPHSSWQQQLTTWQQQLTTSFSRTFDSKAEATRSGDKTSIGLNARLARASMTNLDVGSKCAISNGSSSIMWMAASAADHTRIPERLSTGSTSTLDGRVTAHASAFSRRRFQIVTRPRVPYTRVHSSKYAY